jgi:hypothetical protein
VKSEIVVRVQIPMAMCRNCESMLAKKMRKEIKKTVEANVREIYERCKI